MAIWIYFQMIRLHEFITKIRNCKTQAEERAEYQKEMAAIRESFAVTPSWFRKTRRPWDLAMLPSCSSSICPDNRPISDKWSALNSSLRTPSSKNALDISVYNQSVRTYAALPWKIRAFDDGNQQNSHRSKWKQQQYRQFSLVRSIRDMHSWTRSWPSSRCAESNRLLTKCIGSNSAYIRKKAILTAIKIVKRVPVYIPEFLPKISICFEEKSHGVLLGCTAFLENAISID